MSSQNVEFEISKFNLKRVKRNFINVAFNLKKMKFDFKKMSSKFLWLVIILVRPVNKPNFGALAGQWSSCRTKCRTTIEPIQLSKACCWIGSWRRRHVRVCCGNRTDSYGHFLHGAFSYKIRFLQDGFLPDIWLKNGNLTSKFLTETYSYIV